MKIAAGIGLFLLGSFGLIVAALLIPQIEFYIGGIFILLFIVGVFYIWGNTIRQSRKLQQVHETSDETESTQQG
ncbi:MAG: hypothetical protein PXY39_05160 [archaeon]|nr:hypothetical protein [archaeon]